MTYDIKIINGEIYDGTGTGPRRANIGVRDGRIVEIGDCEGEAGEVIDAQGCVVTPGFVDLHTHYDGQISWDPDMAPSVYHGVTTCVMGSCGVGFAPVHPDDHDRLIALMEGVEDIPGTALAEGIPWGWESFPEYLDTIDNMEHTIDFAAQVPHDALRVYVMRERAVANGPATDEDIERMRQLVSEALDAGAVGFSTGRTDNHRDAFGGATPASEASHRELIGIASAFADKNHGVLQAVSDFDIAHSESHFEPEFDILRQMLEAAGGRPMSLSLIQRMQDTDQWKRLLKSVEDVNEDGHTMRVQVAARGLGVMLGLRATFHPFLGFPTYQEVAHLPLAERVAELRKPEVKAQLLSETPNRLSGDGSSVPPLADMMIEAIEFISGRIYRFTEDFNYEPEHTRSILHEATERGLTPLEVLYDALLEDEGEALLYFPIYNYIEGNFDALHTMLSNPYALPGLSDGGAHVGTVCDASFPTYMISHWTRDRVRGPQLELARVVQMMTKDVADYLGFHDRGHLAVGKRADINVINIEALDLEHPHLVFDLPAGGKRFMQRAHGYRATLCHGEIVVRDDELTGARPGRLVRSGQLS